MGHLRSKACREKLGEARVEELRKRAQKEANDAKRQKFRSTANGKTAVKNYNQSAKGKAVKLNYKQSTKGRETNRVWQQNYLSQRREDDYDGTKDSQNAKKQKERDLKRAAGEPLPVYPKKRKTETAADRHRNFLEATMLGPVFTCICCHIQHFHTNVQQYTNKLKDQLNEKIPTTRCILDEDLFTKVQVQHAHLKTPVDYKKDSQYENKRFICSTCVRHMKAGKLPPSSVMNNLQLTHTDQFLKEQNLQLTELEGTLIAKNIVFQKLVMLPKSRWGCLKDKIINVPIPDDALNETLCQLPRTPGSANLIEITLKRMKKLKNSHMKKVVDTERMFKFLQLLVDSGNPFYQELVDNLDEFKERCFAADPEGYNLLFGDEEDELLEQFDVPMVCGPDGDVVDEVIQEPQQPTTDNKEPEKDIEDRENHPLKKFQMVYDESVYHAHKYPEISVAPGEGQTPKGVLHDRHWDVKAFPQLHNFDGSNGKDQAREVKLTDQRYFIQRILNVEKRFAKNPAFLFAAVAYLEEKRIAQNISLVGIRGQRTQTPEGTVSYELKDEFRCLEAIPNTPKMWQHHKYELLAKLDNFGAFQMFFTLSCADLRWKANFAALLLEKGYSINMRVEVVDGRPQYITEARTANGQWKDIEDFIKEEVEESFHELIRQNVVLCTRYFAHRVKQFISKELMAKCNPLSVRYYSYKVEFQQRGAGHIHGVLWLDLQRLENLVEAEDGTLRHPTDLDFDPVCPLKGISSTFRKLRNNTELEPRDFRVLTRMIEEFTTVSTHPAVVGEDVAKIVKEVNIHKHTITCRKGGRTECRFHFPRPPAPYCIIAQPLDMDMPYEERRAIHKRHHEVQVEVMKVLDNPDSVKAVLEQLPIEEETTKADADRGRVERIKKICLLAGVAYEDYLEALSTSKLGYSVVMKRDINELYVNNFNEHMMRSWDGNMDLQIVLDFFQVITYVADYYAKDDSGTSEVLKAAMDNCNSKDVKERMKVAANVFLKTRQIGEAEAAYRLIPSLTLTMSNVSCQFVGTGMKEERSTRWRKATAEQQNSGFPLVELDGHDGLWYELQDFWSKYLRRPEEIEAICFAQFAKMYKSCSAPKEDGDNSDEPTEDILEDLDNEDLDLDNEALDNEMEPDDEDDFESKFHFIMTFETAGKRGTPLPPLIKLDNPSPGESGFMQKRTKPVALRFHKVKKDREPERFMTKELMLYTPLREEIDPDQVLELYEEMHNDKYKVDIVRGQVMEFLEGVQEARYYVAQAQKELDLQETEEQLDAMGIQDNEDCDEHEEEDHPDYQHCVAEDGEFGNADNQQQAPNIYRSIEVPNDDELKHKMRGLDPNQREVVNIGVKFFKDIVKSRECPHNPYPQAPLVMVHGGAGSGKSTTINVLAMYGEKILRKEGDSMENPIVLKTAFTGCAAANIQGQTLSATFGLGFDGKPRSMTDKTRDRKRAWFILAAALIIDEISMEKNDDFYALDMKCQEITQKFIPFGGLAVFCFGDLMQLRPVKGRFIYEDPVNMADYGETHAWAPRWPMFQSILLEKNHRQGADGAYADLLNKIRIGAQTKDDLKPLMERVRPRGDPDLKEAGLWISCTRKACAEMNKNFMDNLEGETVPDLKAIHHHATDKRYKPKINSKDGVVAETGFANNITMKIGAKLMLISNLDTLDGLTNGTMGELVAVIKTKKGEVDKLVIKPRDPTVGKKNQAKFPQLALRYPGCIFLERQSHTYSISKKSGDVGSTATVIQFPVR